MNVPSVLMTVGESFYKLFEIIDEAQDQGVSKRIPLKAIPTGLIIGLSKIFLAHSKAIIRVTKQKYSLLDLAYALLDEKMLSADEWQELSDTSQFWKNAELHPGDYVPAPMLKIAYAFSKLTDGKQQKYVDELGLEFCMGIIGWSPLTGIQYVVKPGEDDLPDELAHLEGYVDPVQVIYEEDMQAKWKTLSDALSDWPE